MKNRGILAREPEAWTVGPEEPPWVTLVNCVVVGVLVLLACKLV